MYCWGLLYLLTFLFGFFSVELVIVERERERERVDLKEAGEMKWIIHSISGFHHLCLGVNPLSLSFRASGERRREGMGGGGAQYGGVLVLSCITSI